jgi:serine/threonine protein kinase
MAIGPGARIGPYEVTSLLGEGGMGKVWRARHSTLKRDDALKVLPDDLASDADRLARFQREAQLLASLNHPNVAHVYGLEQADGVQALVMELVDGATLADRLMHGPLSLDDALPIARQIADALDAAHDQGIVHRDLKPANIKVRPDSTVKVLDFGLAKLTAFDDVTGSAAGPHPHVSHSPTITSPAMMTRVGVILGTAAYMSPEQARGRAVDKRADIWAFGCVLFEMISGRRAFDGDDVTETLAAVVKSEPPWATLPPATPPSVRRLLERCLRKDPARRLRDIADAKLDIDEAQSEPLAPVSTDTPQSRSARTRERWLWAAALCIAIGARGRDGGGVSAAPVRSTHRRSACRSSPRPGRWLISPYRPTASTSCSLRSLAARPNCGSVRSAHHPRSDCPERPTQSFRSGRLTAGRSVSSPIRS